MPLAQGFWESPEHFVNTISHHIVVAHYGDEHHGGHVKTSAFDYYCVAKHGPGFSPKYLDGEICHDDMGEALCHPNCHQCGPWSACPIEPCPIPDDDD